MMNDNIKRDFGKYLRNLRKSKGLTLMQLEELSKVSNSYLSQIENGKFEPSNDIIRKLSKALEVSYSSLLAKAGYISESFDVLMKEKTDKNWANIPLPKNIKILENDITEIKEIKDPYMIFDLYYIFYLGFNIRYKNEKLSDVEIEKVKVMLKTLLE